MDFKTPYCEENIVDSSPPIKLSSFSAHVNESFILIEWITECEIHNIGYYLHRSTELNGEYLCITPEIINGNRTSSEKQIYNFIDRDIQNGITYWYKLENISMYGERTMYGPISATVSFAIVPESFKLYQNYPNPFNPLTNIKFTLPTDKNVRIDIYNTKGEHIQKLLDKLLTAGDHQIEFNAKNIPSGLYTYKITMGNFQEVKKMLYLK